MKQYNIPNNEWWRMNKEEDEISIIEWSSKMGGWCRAKLDSISEWSYQKCSNAKYAESFGRKMIEKQKEERVNNEHYQHYFYTVGDEYQGA